jgi:predicted nucleic acid-binding protein
MKHLHVKFSDIDFMRLKKARALSKYYSKDWRDFILLSCCKGVSVKHIGEKSK